MTLGNAFFAKHRFCIHEIAVIGLATLAIALSACSTRSAPQPTSTGTPHYIAVARGTVGIEGGLIKLSAPVAGTLASMDVHDGEEVRKGQVLATLSSRQAQLAVSAAQIALAQAQAQLQLDIIQRQAAKLRAQRLSAAAVAGVGSGQSADNAKDSVAAASARQVIDKNAVAMAREHLESAQYALQQHRLIAPMDSRVVKVQGQPGISVTPSGDPLFVLLPDKPRIVRAQLNESFVNAVRRGMQADVVAGDGQDPQHWHAHVLRIGQIYGPATLENTPALRTHVRAVECILAFDKPVQPRIGLRVVVRFLPSHNVPIRHERLRKPASSKLKG
ncbi:MAG: HlyD family secretion protein [Rhodanobacteraceae bacterium]